MAITRNHTIVPARDKEAAARFFAEIFGARYEVPKGHFAPVRVNETLTFDFDAVEGPIPVEHYAFHVSDAEFDTILQRLKAAGMSFGSTPWSLDDDKRNDWNGGRGVYWKDRDGHILELMTVPQWGAAGCYGSLPPRSTSRRCASKASPRRTPGTSRRSPPACHAQSAGQRRHAAPERGVLHARPRLTGHRASLDRGTGPTGTPPRRRSVVMTWAASAAAPLPRRRTTPQRSATPG